MKHKRTFEGLIFAIISLLAVAGCSKWAGGSYKSDTDLHEAVATRYYCWIVACSQHFEEETEESYQEDFDHCVDVLTDPQEFGQRLRQTDDNCLFDECIAMEGVYTLAGCETVTDECWDPTVTGGGE